MKYITCKDSSLYPFRLKKFGRVKKIYWNKYGHPYYNRHGLRVFLDTVERLSYPYFYEDEEGKDAFISGWEYIGACGCLYVEIINDGESVQLWEEC